MRINTKVTAIEPTPAISDYLSSKLAALEKFIDAGDDSAVCDVEIGKTTNHHRTGDIFRAEINLQWEGTQFYAATEKDDLYAAIDEVKDEILKEIEKSKKKEDTLIKRGGQEAKDMLKGLDEV